MKLTTARTALFGPYALDLRSGELRKFGTKVKMGEQPFQILRLLLETPGEMVTREELREKLWAKDTFVDFDHGLNSAVQRLRDCLSDTAGKPRWVEAIPRRGYRFVGQLEWSNGDSEQPTPALSAVSYAKKLSWGAKDTSKFEASLFHRFFLLFGATPYRRWEIMHLRMILWCLLLAYLGWRFMSCAPDKWGFVLFFLELACIGLLVSLLGFLLYTGTSDPSGLSREVRRMAPWVRWSTVTLVLVTWAMAGTVVVSHHVLAAFLVLCGTTGGCKYLVFKAAFDHAAFPESQ